MPAFRVGVGGQGFRVKGLPEAERKLRLLESQMFEALPVLLNEAGLFMEREIKINTRVDTGTLRASIGHYTAGDIRPGKSGKSMGRSKTQASMAAVFTPPSPSRLVVTVGTRIRYAPAVNYKLGDRMFEKGLQATVAFLPSLVDQYIGAVRV